MNQFTRDNEALFEYVNYYYRTEAEIEDIQDENIIEICRELGLEDYTDELRMQMNKIKQKDLLGKQICHAKPSGISVEEALKIYI